MELKKIDPHNSKQYLDIWKSKDLNLSSINTVIIRNYISDMEQGLNTSGSSKGARSQIKLLSIARQMQRLIQLIEEQFNINDVRKISQEQLHKLFNEMANGNIKRIDGKMYKSVGDYTARFKAFWHWHIKVEKKKDKLVLDITEDLEANKKKKPEFVYFTKEDLDKMLTHADYDTKPIILFLFDTGIRCPTELMNIRASDFSEDFKELDIREETSKTFGRKIKLMLCSDIIQKYISDNHFKDNDLIFTIQPATLNKRLKIIGKNSLGEKQTKGRKSGKDLTMYDFRHSSACYWLPRYKSIASLLYRFGWKREEEIHYYTQLLGMKDTITEDDLMLGADKSYFEKEIATLKETIDSWSPIIKEIEKAIWSGKKITFSEDK